MVPRASGLVFEFCAPDLIFGGSEGAGTNFRIPCSWTLFLVVSWTPGPVLEFHALKLVFGDILLGTVEPPKVVGPLYSTLENVWIVQRITLE
jgi:hypothetical protein